MSHAHTLRALTGLLIASVGTGCSLLSFSADEYQEAGAGGEPGAGGTGGTGGAGGAEPTCSDGIQNGDETLAVDCGGGCLCVTGQPCGAAFDCVSKSCIDEVCRAASCNDTVLNGSESDVDCGGQCPDRCEVGDACNAGADCAELVCSANICQAPSCSDMQPNGDETDVDCGGTCPDACAAGESCLVAADCGSGVCGPNGVCLLASCSDGVQNSGETDLDCGGPCGATCLTDAACAGAVDCFEHVCSGSVCLAPTCADGAQNDVETDVDCGGSGSCPRCVPTDGCDVGSDCQSLVCAANACAAPACNDGVKNGIEGGQDCSGNCPSLCADDAACTVASDCQSGVCPAGTCVAATCFDSVDNGTETDVDCGGTCVANCDTLEGCVTGADCVSGVCPSGSCVAASCADFVQNNSETAVDCGGGAPCAPCDDGLSCVVAGDCESNVCAGTPKTCSIPTCIDGQTNGGETDTDCGGPGSCPRCAPTFACTQGSDCESLICFQGECTTPSCTDTVMNDAETDVDCGGSGTCPRCAPTDDCVVGADCQSLICTASTCSTPMCDDGVENGTETDLDCGGGCTTKCANGLSCSNHLDCVSGACGAGNCGPWSTRFGDANFDAATGVAFDPAGNIIVVGRYGNAQMFGGIPLPQIGGNETVIAKLSPTGALLWAKGLGTAGHDIAMDVAVDGLGNIAVVGLLGGPLDFGNGPVTFAGGYDVFVAKLDPDGDALWSRGFGSAALAEWANGVAFDPAGDVLVTGQVEGSVDFGGGVLPYAGGTDVFALKLTGASGVHLWSKTFGETREDSGWGIDSDAAGSVFLTGSFFNTVDFGGGGLTGGAHDWFLVKLSASGAHLWSEKWGGDSGYEGLGPDRGHDLAVDTMGDVVVVGSVKGTGSAYYGGAVFPTGTLNGFVAKYRGTNGAHAWSLGFGQADGAGLAVALDAAGNPLVHGLVCGAGVDLGGGPLSYGGACDVFIAKLASANGAHLFSQSYPNVGDANYERAAIAVSEATGNVAIGGNFSDSIDFGPGAMACVGSYDGFIASLGPLP